MSLDPERQQGFARSSRLSWPAIVLLSGWLIALILGISEQSFPIHLAVIDRGQFGDEIHDLVLEQGRTDLGLGLGIVGIELEYLLLLAGELADLVHDRRAQLVVRHSDAVLLSDLGDLLFRIEFSLDIAPSPCLIH